MSGEGFSDGGGGLGDSAAGAGEAGSYGGFNGSGDPVSSSARPVANSRPPPAASEQQPSPSRPDDGPPGSWAKDAAGHWHRVPAELRSYIRQREAESHAKIAELGTPAKLAREIDQVFQQHAVQVAPEARGQTIGLLLQAQQALVRDPGKFIKYLAQHAGVDLRALAGGGDGGGQAGRLQHAEARHALMVQAIEQLQAENQALKRQQSEALERQKADAVKHRAEQDRQIKEARRHSSLNQTSTGGRVAPVKGTVRQTLERHASRLMGS